MLSVVVGFDFVFALTFVLSSMIVQMSFQCHNNIYVHSF